MKFERVKGDVPVFSQDYDGRDRTIFGGTEQSNDINDQFTNEFKKGWGIVGKNEFPTLQDFNALGFTHSTLLSYLYQAGVPEWDSTTEYYKGSVVTYNNEAWISKKDKPSGAPENAQNDWKLVIAGEYVGTGRWMREGAYGLGGGVYATTLSVPTIEEITGNKTAIVNNNHDESFNRNSYGIFFKHIDGYQGYLGAGWTSGNNDITFHSVTPTYSKVVKILTDKNTRTDKNNVLHSGTKTPIDTLNVSDMAQDVVNRDDVTVTSGAVYRGLAKKRDKTDNVFLGESIALELGDYDSIGTFIDSSSYNRGIFTRRGGTRYEYIGIPDKSGTFALTSDIIGINQKWQDVTSQRQAGSTYTNNTGKPIVVNIEGSGSTSASIYVTIDGYRFKIGNENSTGMINIVGNVVIPAGANYKIDGPISVWSELR